MSAIPLKELISLTDEEIIKRNSEEADKYIKLRDVLKSEISNSSVDITKPKPMTLSTKPISPTPKPKRKCTEKQLAALAAGRAKNPRLMKKLNNETETKK